MGQQKHSREKPAQKAAVAVVERLKQRMLKEGDRAPADWRPFDPKLAPANIIGFMVRDNVLEAEGVWEGFTLIVDTDAKREAGKLAVLLTEDGGYVCKLANAREARSRLWVGRVTASLGPFISCWDFEMGSAETG